MDGSTDASLNVTFNYSGFYYAHLNFDGGLRWLDKKPAHTTIDSLRSAILELGFNQDADYWAVTPGNAGYALWILLAWATLHPDAKWLVT